MSFHDVDFPITIGYRSSGGPYYPTRVVALSSGAESRNVLYGNPRFKYNVALGVRDYADLAALQTFFIARQGATHSFRFKDWLNFTTASDHRSAYAADDETLGTYDGSTNEFQLIKTYTSGGVTRTENVTKPVDGTVKIAYDGVEQLTGWSVNTSTGKVTLTALPGMGEVVTGGCEYDKHVRFNIDDEWMNASLDDFESGSVAVDLITVISEEPVFDEFFFRGSKHVTGSNEITLAHSDGSVIVLEDSATPVNMPDPTSGHIASGAPHFFIVNAGLSSVALQDHNGASIGTLASGAIAEILLSFDGTTYYWWAR